MKHKKYERINGLWHQKSVVYMLAKGWGRDDIEWCVTEKVHGSNFAFYINQNEIKVAKRGSFLKEGENFFQYTRMEESNGYKVRNLWDQLVFMGEKLEEVVVYGELFGGYYPHPDVPQPKNVRKIQKGVYYHPDIKFYCFDIMVNGEFLPMDIVCDLCEVCNIFYAEILFRGTYEECSKRSNKFQTLIPSFLGLPPIEDNICEGIVLKPIEPKRFEDGERVILKSKNDKFLEVSKERKPKSLRKPDEMTPYTVEAVEVVQMYVTENRLRNVLSKFGHFTKKDFAAIHHFFKQDIILEFTMNHRYMNDIFDEQEEKVFKKVLGRLVTLVWRPIFLQEAE